MFTTKTCPIAVTALLVSFTVIVSKAQSGPPSVLDTLAYLRNNVSAKQQRFLNKPLDVLLKQVKFPVRAYSVSNWRLSDPDPLHVRLFFEDARPGYKACYIRVGFGDEVSKHKAVVLISESWGEWNLPVQRFYGPLAVRSIEVGKLE